MQGSGEKNNPYLISKAEDFLLVNDIDYSIREDNERGYCKIVSDIDMNNFVTDLECFDITGLYLNGNNHTIKNFYNVGTGFFQISSYGQIKTELYDLFLDNIEITEPDTTYGTRNKGLLISSVQPRDYSQVIIKNCHIQGQFNQVQSDYFGGFSSAIIPYENSFVLIEDCSTDVVVNWVNYNECYYIGGFTGSIMGYNNAKTEIRRCSAKIELLAENAPIKSVGGFTGDIHMYSFIEDGDYCDVTIEDCYSKGILTGNEQSVNFASFCGRVWINGGGPGVLNLKRCYGAVDIPHNGFVNYEGYEGYGGFIGHYYIDVDTNISHFFDYCYYNEELAPNGDFTEYAFGRTTEEMTEPPAPNTYLNWAFNDVWFIYSNINDGYPVLVEYNIVDDSIYFLQAPAVKSKMPQANSIIVKSPTAVYELKQKGVSDDKLVQRIVEIEEGDLTVCRTIAEKLLENWGRELKAVTGEIENRMNLNFKQKINITVPDLMEKNPYVVQKITHDVLAQKTTVACGDLILSDNELLARFLKGGE